MNDLCQIISVSTRDLVGGTINEADKQHILQTTCRRVPIKLFLEENELNVAGAL